MNSPAQRRLLVRHLARAGLLRLLRPGHLRNHGVLELTHSGTRDLRGELLGSGRWLEDPLPKLRARLKPWVTWSAREMRIGLALHIEQERDALSVHLDVLSPSRVLPLYPAHAFVDLWGWSRLRPIVLRRLAR